MKLILTGLLLLLLNAFTTSKQVSFRVLDTYFSKGRLIHQQTIRLKDLGKFHGHLCDRLVAGALAMQQVLDTLYPNQPIDRTNIRIVSKSSPCLRIN
ncbi:MAG: FmdE family protein [Ferruginibacter sp.]